MIDIAITGNIGSGKTEVIKFLQSLKFKCISSDHLISNFYKDDYIREIILKKMNLPEKNYKEIIIAKLRNEKFNRKLKKTIYPILYSEKKRIKYKHFSYKPTFYEIPLLFEENLSHNFDLSIFIQADTIKRKKRVLKKGMNEEYFNMMDKKQINQNKKQNLSNFIIKNNGSILNLRLNIITLLKKI